MQNLPIKKRFFVTFKDTGISLFLMGDIERGESGNFLFGQKVKKVPCLTSAIRAALSKSFPASGKYMVMN